jgi:pilus assembly protein FimV
MMGVILGLLLVILGYLFWQRRRMNAAVYAFDSGIPELETADNSSFAPAAKAGGWFSRKNANAESEADIVAEAREAAAAKLRGATTAAPDTLVDIDLSETSVKSRYLVEEEMLEAVAQADTSDEVFSRSFQTGSAAATSRTITAEDDDADLADALIAEAKGIATDSEKPSFPAYGSVTELAEAEQEAEALAELVTPDVAITESAIPESFEFTLKTAPEALAEEADIATPDDIESFDFQLSGSSTAEKEATATADTAAQHEMSDEELQLSTLLLDEEEGDFQSGAPLNECDTKLDLAVAYEAMGDIEGALEILGEVIADGDSAQIAEANRLKGLWQSS